MSAVRPGCYSWSNRTTPRSSLKPSESRDLGGEVVDALAAPARRSCGRLGLPVERRRACRRNRARRGAQVRHRELGENGRASCRERVCQYVLISVVAVSLKKKKNTIPTTLHKLKLTNTRIYYNIQIKTSN